MVQKSDLAVQGDMATAVKPSNPTIGFAIAVTRGGACVSGGRTIVQSEARSAQ